jgi:hypothetical protein
MCGFIDCTKKVKAKGYCTGHYAQLMSGVELSPLKGTYTKKCEFDGCENKAIGKLCNGHYQQARTHGIENLKPLRKIAKRGEGTINQDGYRKIYKPGHPNASAHGTILEHRYVMSEMLGRPLLDSESVHHKNGDRADNRPENLELWVKTQPAGQRPEDLLEWAYEIIKRYGDENDSRFSDFSRE